MKKNLAIVISCLFTLLLLVSSCKSEDKVAGGVVKEITKYVCPDGSTVDTPNGCTTTTLYGADKVIPNLPRIIDNTQNVYPEDNPSLEVNINSASKERVIDIWSVYKDVGLGFIYLVIDVTIINPTQHTYDFSSYHTKIVDSNGYSYKRDVSSTSLKPYFDDVRIKPGGKASGKLSYAIPIDAKGLKLVIYDYSGDMLIAIELE